MSNKNHKSQEREGIKKSFQEIKSAVLDSIAKLVKEAKILGKKHGNRMKPPPEEDELQPYIESFTTGFDELRSEVKNGVLEGYTPELVEVQIGNAREELSELEDEIIEQKDEVIDAKEKLEQSNPPYSRDKIKYWKLSIVAIVFLDSLFGFAAFQVIGSSWLISLVLGFLFGAFLYAAAHYIPILIRKYLARQYRWIALVGVFLVMGGLFYAIGTLRSDFLSQTGSPGIDPMIFAIINLLFFALALGIVWIKFPTEEEKKEMEEFEAIEAYYQSAEEKLKTLEDKKQAIKADIKHKYEDAARKKGQFQYLLELIDSGKQTAISKYINTNLLARRDNVTPRCFRHWMKQSQNNKFIN